MSSSPSSQHQRLRVALEANGLDTSGTLQECLDRLLQSRGHGKKRARTASKRKSDSSTVTGAIASSIAANVSSKLSRLPQCVLDQLSGLLDDDLDAEPDAIAEYLVAGSS